MDLPPTQPKGGSLRLVAVAAPLCGPRDWQLKGGRLADMKGGPWRKQEVGDSGNEHTVKTKKGKEAAVRYVDTDVEEHRMDALSVLSKPGNTWAGSKLNGSLALLVQGSISGTRSRSVIFLEVWYRPKGNVPPVPVGISMLDLDGKALTKVKSAVGSDGCSSGSSNVTTSAKLLKLNENGVLEGNTVVGTLRLKVEGEGNKTVEDLLSYRQNTWDLSPSWRVDPNKPAEEEKKAETKEEAKADDAAGASTEATTAPAEQTPAVSPDTSTPPATDGAADEEAKSAANTSKDSTAASSAVAPPSAPATSAAPSPAPTTPERQTSSSPATPSNEAKKSPTPATASTEGDAAAASPSKSPASNKAQDSQNSKAAAGTGVDEKPGEGRGCRTISSCQRIFSRWKK